MGPPGRRRGGAATWRPEEIEICFGVTLDGKLGGVIASANAGAHLDVTLRWHGPGGKPDGDVAPA